MLRNAKLSLLHASRALGVSSLARDSEWRRRQLLILCYHGISIDDEHRWAPGLYMTEGTFASRLEALRRARCTVLPLGEALDRLAAGTLPKRSVALTFDDGNYDFHARAWPLLQRYDLPATVYLTTYYSENNLPIFPLVISYVLWRGRGVEVSCALGPLTVTLDTRSAAGRRRTHDVLVHHAQTQGLSAVEKDALAARVADALDVDYAAIRQRRLLHIMRPDEVREVAAAGVDVQLHTHRHRSPLERERYRAEVADNRTRIASFTKTTPRHFCYPSGVCLPQFEGWLREDGVDSATTCEPGMATRQSNRLRLPRLLDHSDMTLLEFDAWIAGLGALLPHRPVGFHPVDADGRPLITPPGGTPSVESADAGASSVQHARHPAELST